MVKKVMGTIKVNVNWMARVRVRPNGVKIVRKAYATLGGDAFDTLYTGRLDDEGRWRVQIHEIMEMFGSHLYVGCDPPFDPDFEIEAEIYYAR